jgi:hypothetical protein
MDEPKVKFNQDFSQTITEFKFGDKIFVYGQFMSEDFLEEHDLINPIYNSVMGYVATGGYLVVAEKSTQYGVCLPGFVVDFLQQPSLAVLPPFDLIDVTDILSLQSPSTLGNKVWMPI